jgi:hypothetical protein
MKKNILLFSFSLSLIFANAQTCEGPALLNENFTNGIPANWTILNLDTCTTMWTLVTKGFTGQFQAFNHYGEKCVANCAQFEYTGTANDYLITPAVTLGNGPCCLSWKASSQYTFYPEAYEVRISTTTPDVAGLMAHAPLYSTTAEPIRWNEHDLDLSAYANQTIYIGFHYISSNQWTFFMDDIRISQPTTNDLRLSELNFSDAVMPGSYSVTGKILNGGTNSVSSCTINWKLGNGPVQTMSQNLSLAPSGYYNFTHANLLTLSTNGTYTLKVWTDLPNNLADNYRTNDTITRTIYVHTNPKELLFEEFTQASCSPCASQNPGFDALYLYNHPLNKANLVKYQCPFPGVDPMNAFNQQDVSNRMLYYGTGGIPFALMNGLVDLNSNCQSNDAYPQCIYQYSVDSANQYPGIFNITIQHSFISTTQGMATVTVTPLLNIPSNALNLRVALVERDIVYSTPPGSNGETEFHQVMRYLLPDADGTPLTNLQANAPQTFTFFHNIDSVFVPTDLRIVAWVQDDNSSFIYQSNSTDTNAVTGISSYAIEHGIFLFPNPSNGNATLQLTSENNSEITIRIFDLSGKLMKEEQLQKTAGTQQFVLQTTELSSGIYFVEVVQSESIQRVKFVRE